jgi:N-hydroxyarylamine O-acetyltransferase
MTHAGLVSSPQIDAYLTRIGVPEPAAADAAVLRRLHRAHLLAVPFENLSIHLGEPISLAPDDLLAKVVTRRRGGFCYELNGAFALLLEALGFGVRRVAAKVYGADGTPGPPFDHLALLADVPGGGTWLADVGFGSHSSYPLDFSRRDEDQDDPGGVFRLVPAAGQNGGQNAGTGTDIDVLRGGQPQYRIETRTRDLDEFAPTCWWQQTWPGSHFRQSTICSRLTPSGRVSLSGRTLIETRDGTRTETGLGTDDEALAAYAGHFGITLDRVPEAAA